MNFDRTFERRERIDLSAWIDRRRDVTCSDIGSADRLAEGGDPMHTKRDRTVTDADLAEVTRLCGGVAARRTHRILGAIVTTNGRVFTVGTRGARGPRLRERKIVLDACGYPCLRLGRTVKVHRLILEAFVGLRPPGHQARHLDGNRAHSSLSNLVWGTVQENSDDRKRHGTIPRGSRVGNSKLTDSDVIEIRRRAVGGERFASIARHFGVHPSVVSRIASGHSRAWRHITDGEALGIDTKPAGARNGFSKLDPDAVRSIRALSAEGVDAREIAKRFSIDRNHVYKIAKRKLWAHVS